jgi:hypothetical protein
MMLYKALTSIGRSVLKLTMGMNRLIVVNIYSWCLKVAKDMGRESEFRGPRRGNVAPQPIRAMGIKYRP